MAAVTAIGVFAGVVISSGQVRAWDADSPWLGDARVIEGFKIAPVPLNLAKKNKVLVGLGSYLVNAVGNCNGCHVGPTTEFTPTGNRYFLSPPFDRHTKINPATYLSGGNDFGPFPGPGFAHIISRNLTPDKTGLPLRARARLSRTRSITTAADAAKLRVGD